MVPPTTAPVDNGLVLVRSGYHLRRCSLDDLLDPGSTIVCTQEVTYDGDIVTMTEYRLNGPAEPPTNTGRLTDAGRVAIEDAVAALDPTRMAEIVNCGTCQWGGLGVLAFETPEGTRSYDYTWGEPVPTIGALDAIVTSILDALVSCTPTSYITPNEECQPTEPLP
jgi:hypothetical protein